MNATADAPAPGFWSRRRWLGAIGVALAAQLALLLLLGRPAATPRRPETFPTIIHLAADETISRALRGLPGVDDAALFALPSREGFSGGTWFTFAPMRHERADWSEEPRWLAPKAGRLGGGVAELLAATPEPVRRIADQPTPRPAHEERRVPFDAVAAQSRLRVTGALAGRGPPETAPLPSWAHGELLSNTVVQVAVDAEGWTRSATLLGRCGFPPADEWALQHATALRHQPSRSGARSPAAPGLAWGRLVYQWHTLAPVPTNTAALGPHSP